MEVDYEYSHYEYMYQNGTSEATEHAQLIDNLETYVTGVIVPCLGEYSLCVHFRGGSRSLGQGGPAEF